MPRNNRHRLKLHSDGMSTFREFCWLAFCWLIIALVVFVFWLVGKPAVACLVAIFTAVADGPPPDDDGDDLPQEIHCLPFTHSH
ncbi:MAG: hypothetical protein JWO08_1178 [Verrucomicrobiaceae bacterium]|nr:hypothetical protein [Verrucomicrobiaceae bacterium]